ncbi:MAG: hypothetical protein J07HX64_02700 [halophilic archaeon J07HX64]|nr:MAG: hypothetical protein J07HX64_02700 [halophilic archaeon J07HX64]
MAPLFLVGPLVVLAELDFFDTFQDPIERNDTGDSGSDSGTDGTITGEGGNGTDSQEPDGSIESTGGNGTPVDRSVGRTDRWPCFSGLSLCSPGL